MVKSAVYWHVGGRRSNHILRRRLHFILSEQYTARRYYAWSLAFRSLLACYRCLEMPAYVVFACAVRILDTARTSRFARQTQTRSETTTASASQSKPEPSRPRALELTMPPVDGCSKA